MRFRRSLIALGVALTLPTVVFVAVAIFYFLRNERAHAETETLAQARSLMSAVDTRLQSDAAVLETLSTSVYFDRQDWEGLYRRTQRILEDRRSWVSMALYDTQARREIFDLGRPFGEARSYPPARVGDIDQSSGIDKLIVGAVMRGQPSVIWIYRRVNGYPRYVLGTAINTDAFQTIVRAQVDAHLGAIVDHNGNFVARSYHYAERVGTPGTEYLRKAIRDKRAGIYAGITYEGMKNYTAFEVSAISGWSAHYAVPSNRLDAPITWSFVVIGLAGLGSLVLAGVLAVLVVREVSERRTADEALRQSQKMEAVGQLTGGIAHDFNNLLTAIIGNLDLIRTRASGNERLRRLADNALEAARRGAKLASQLLAFSRSQRMNVGQVDLAALLRGMSGLLTQSIGPSIELRIHIDPKARWVVSDPNQLELALLNLAVNARDAMPKGGTLTIEAKRAANVARNLPPGDYIHLCVSDTGSGMSDAVKARAIEPFFTTKPVGQGTGLGLSQVYGVIRESGGALDLESTEGEGTMVRLTLKQAVPTRTTLANAPAPLTVPAPSAATEKTILVVDDDRLVRRFMVESLRNLRYRVFDAERGDAALELLKTMHFDVLIADFAMPGMNGAELVRAALDMQPHVATLIVSGYADSTALEGGLESVRQLRKPFDVAELGAAVAELLAADDTSGQSATATS
jgi:signal transduction histidine kinase/ActR/RegA family two-component response regulator